MKKAIITGATGFVGLAVAKRLSDAGKEVLCLGRRHIEKPDALRCFGINSLYLRIEMDEILSLRSELERVGWAADDDCVFFNFAWSGKSKLTDGGFDLQLKNASYAADAVRAAKSVGCTKFVDAGTLEETYTEQFLSGGYRDTFFSSQTDYALAKLATRDLCKVTAYLEKIDYVHTRLSVPLSSDLSQRSYVAQTLGRIADGQPFPQPTNSRLCDIIFIEDVAKAYQLIGEDGKNKADYFVGSARPATLSEYFQSFEQQVRGFENSCLQTQNKLDLTLLSTASLFRDTGFVAARKFEDLFYHLKSL